MINIDKQIIHNKIIHYVDNNLIIASRNTKIFISNDYGLSWAILLKIPLNFLNTLKSIHKLSRRLFRMGIYHIIKTKTNFLIIFGFGNIYQYNLQSKELLYSGKIQGSRPLCICYAKEIVYYGEYFSNEKRRDVKIYESLDSGITWKTSCIIKNIRHIHGIFFDSYSNNFWVTTGDYNEEIGIWYSNDNLKTIKKVFSDSQQVRTIQLLFTEDYVYFGSDTSLEINHIYRFQRNNFVIEKLQKVKGSIFYGCKIGDKLFFSTACEPSKINSSNYVELWTSIDGSIWKLLLTIKKDIWSKKYFQYGQIKFPYGENCSNLLWISPLSTKLDQKTIKIKII